MCLHMSLQDDIHFDEMFIKGVMGIRAEVSTYEQSMQSILTQLNLIRAAQDAVNVLTPDVAV